MRYINQGTTLGSVNVPEVQMRSLTLDESDTARVSITLMSLGSESEYSDMHWQVIFIHRNVPGVLRKVNEILGDHNVDKQISDSRGDVAYLMADVSSVKYEQIKDIFDSLEALSCKSSTTEKHSQDVKLMHAQLAS